MKIKIDAVEMPQSPLHQKGATYCYPLVLNQQTLTTEDMVSHIQNISTLTKIDCHAVIEAINGYIAKSLAEGNQIHIDGLGTFSTALRFSDSAKSAAQQTAGDVTVVDVNFRPERELLSRLTESMEFERKEALHSSNVQLSDVVLRLQEHFTAHHDLTSRQFETMFDLKHSRANKVLTTLYEQGKLQRHHVGHAYVYHAGPKLYPQQESSAAN